MILEVQGYTSIHHVIKRRERFFPAIETGVLKFTLLGHILLFPFPTLSPKETIIDTTREMECAGNWITPSTAPPEAWGGIRFPQST